MHGVGKHIILFFIYDAKVMIPLLNICLIDSILCRKHFATTIDVN